MKLWLDVYVQDTCMPICMQICLARQNVKYLNVFLLSWLHKLENYNQDGHFELSKMAADCLISSLTPSPPRRCDRESCIL